MRLRKKTQKLNPEQRQRVTEMHRNDETEIRVRKTRARWRHIKKQRLRETHIHLGGQNPGGAHFLFNKIVHTWPMFYRNYFLEAAVAIVWQLQAYQARAPPQA